MPTINAAQCEMDRLIGRELEAIRRSRRLKQSCVGRALGVSFQQIHRYETGASRLSASKLWLAAQLFDVPLTDFYRGLP